MDPALSRESLREGVELFRDFVDPALSVGPGLSVRESLRDVVREGEIGPFSDVIVIHGV